MLLVLRCLGWTLMVIGFAVLGIELMNWAQGGLFTLHTIGQLWFNLDPGSLNLLQAVTERYLSVWIWDQVFAPLLLWTALPAFMIPGIVLAESHRIFQLVRHFVAAKQA